MRLLICEISNTWIGLVCFIYKTALPFPVPHLSSSWSSHHPPPPDPTPQTSAIIQKLQPKPDSAVNGKRRVRTLFVTSTSVRCACLHFVLIQLHQCFEQTFRTSTKHTYVYTYIYIYMYIEREREREREMFATLCRSWTAFSCSKHARTHTFALQRTNGLVSSRLRAFMHPSDPTKSGEKVHSISDRMGNMIQH